MKISTLIERAINTALWDGKKPLYSYPEYKVEFSYIAVCLAMDGGCYGPIDIGLSNMGVKTGSITQFRDISIGPKHQYARALWLTWAALMAKEQGL